MEPLSWTEVDDLRGRLGSQDRAAFDAQLRVLSVAEADDGALGELLDRWSAIAHPELTVTTSAA